MDAEQKVTGTSEKVFSEKHHANVGPLLGILVIVLVLIFGGLYLWGAMLAEQAAPATPERFLPNNEPETTRAMTDTDILDTMSPSTELDAIYADLESTNLDTLDSELDQVLGEMDAAMRE